VFVDIFIGPLPDIPRHIHHSKWARARGMCVNVVRRAQSAIPN
jgi:hypothetical protein